MTRTSQVIAIVAVLFAAAHAHAASTARAALPQVAEAAKKWQPDAVVTHVSTLGGKADGKASAWLYTVYSPKVKKSAIVTARDTKVELEEVLRNSSTEALPAEYLDSDKALDAARKAGFKTDGKDIGFGLTTFGTSTKKPFVAWAITILTPQGASSVTLDSKDGALIKRDEVKFK